MQKNLLRSIFILFISLLHISLTAQVIYVNTNASVNGDGTSWANAFDDLQSALAVALNGDEIWVSKGSYFVNGTTDDSFEIPSGVKVFGGFEGNENQRQSRNWINNETILDGVFNIHTVVYFENSNTDTTIDGFIIQNGFADGINPRGQSAGAIFIQNASPAIANCRIRDNESVGQGGAIFIEGSFANSSSPNFKNCTIENNTSSSNGGALFGGGNNNGTCNPTFEKCIFKNNSCSTGGGAIFLNGVDGNATCIFKACDFDSNIANGNGGAMYTLSKEGGVGNHEIINSRFYNNKGFAAGGMYNHGGGTNGNGIPGDCSPLITNCTFYLNEATGVPAGLGGAIYNNAEGGGNSSPIISNSIIYGNISEQNSHVFRNVDGTPTIKNSLVDVADCSALNQGPNSDVTCEGLMIYTSTDPFKNAAGGDLRLIENSEATDTGSDNDNNEPEDLDCEQRKINTIDMGAYESPDQELPVELAEFLAYQEKDKVTLMWITFSEVDNDYFTIERSANGRDFEALETVQGAGNSTQARVYERHDFNPIPGDNYYRIKNTSFSGEVEYSPIRIVEISPKRINVFPNPVERHLTIAFSDFKADEAQFEIYDVYGKQVFQGSTQVEDNVSFIALPEIGSFVPGTYILKIYTVKNGSFSHRFMKIRD